jgi:hypothetical protein
MIKLQKFNPPPAFPPRDLSASEREMYLLGIKLTCAFELLTSSNTPWFQSIIDLWNNERQKKVNDIELKGWDENCEEPDNEEWMILSAEDKKRIMAENKGEEEQVKEMIASLEKFMEGESGFEGIDDE